MTAGEHDSAGSLGFAITSWEKSGGIDAIVNIKGPKSHGTVADALKIVENLEHRAGKDAEGKTGDGVGILLQISHKFFSKVCESPGIFLGLERDYGVGNRAGAFQIQYEHQFQLGAGVSEPFNQQFSLMGYTNMDIQ